jgi:hypothetical protein
MVLERQEALQKAKEQMELAFNGAKDEQSEARMADVRESLIDLSKVCKETAADYEDADAGQGSIL